jgi:hypothetical protein
MSAGSRDGGVRVTFDELFERQPWRWGLRGDPHVWNAMRERLRGRPIPGSGFDVRRILEQTFTEVTGAELSSTVDYKDHVSLERFRTGSGMSDGVVSLHFWAHTGIPILIDRAAAAAADGYAD